MSYEGYVQMLCENGHYHCRDAYEDLAAPCGCGAHMVWHNNVDDTNGNSEGDIDIDKFEVLAPVQLDTCECCGHTTVKEDETYKIPTPEQTRSWRRRWDPEKEDFVPLEE